MTSALWTDVHVDGCDTTLPHCLEKAKSANRRNANPKAQRPRPPGPTLPRSVCAEQSAAGPAARGPQTRADRPEAARTQTRKDQVAEPKPPVTCPGPRPDGERIIGPRRTVRRFPAGRTRAPETQLRHGQPGLF